MRQESAQRQRDRANCCASVPVIRLMVSCLVGCLTSALAVLCLQSLSRAVRARQKTTEVEMIQYKDILSCCRQNGRINCAVHAYYRQSPLGGGLIFAAFRGGARRFGPPLNTPLGTSPLRFPWLLRLRYTTHQRSRHKFCYKTA